MSIQKKAVVISGASTGIGAACALELERRGFQVFAGVRSDEAESGLKAKSSGRLIPIRLDITDARQIEDAVARVREETGEKGLYGLVNNAGIAIAGPMELVPMEEIHRQFEVNFFGHLAMTQAFLPMIRQAKGRIVFTSSINGAMSPPYFGPYSASKWALEAMVDALRLELRFWKIEVLSVLPGPIDTPIWKKSLASADVLSKKIAPEIMSMYEADLDIVRAMAKESSRIAAPVEKVVEAVVHALTASKPNPRYYLRFRNRLLSRGFKVVPDRLRDWIIKKAMKLK
jgi:NAD(P)-dependent dehydrogenase (short-subunit alcohol dehydrogenase family)